MMVLGRRRVLNRELTEKNSELPVFKKVSHECLILAVINTFGIEFAVFV